MSRFGPGMQRVLAWAREQGIRVDELGGEQLCRAIDAKTGLATPFGLEPELAARRWSARIEGMDIAAVNAAINAGHL